VAEKASPPLREVPNGQPPCPSSPTPSFVTTRNHPIPVDYNMVGMIWPLCHHLWALVTNH